jgi:uncharacterized membrane protein YkvA (DUF1232 family)
VTYKILWAIAVVVYFLMPFDAVFDFVPVIGYLDDAVVVLVGMRKIFAQGAAKRGKVIDIPT